MTKYIITRDDFGHNTGVYITPELPDSKRVKISELPQFTLTPSDYVIRWGLTSTIPNGPKIINKRKAILETSNKGTFRKKVADAGLATKTWLTAESFSLHAMENGFHPVIVRPLHHQRSEDLVFAETPKAALDAFKKFDRAHGGAYISEFLDKQKEYRVFVANGRAMIVAEKIPKDAKEVSWGCVEEGVLDYIFWTDWRPEVVATAIKAFNLSSLDFAAVDLLWKDGQAYFLEANTAPEVWKYYGKCFAKVFTHMTANDHGRDRIPVEDYTSWKGMIHPAINA